MGETRALPGPHPAHARHEGERPWTLVPGFDPRRRRPCRGRRLRSDPRLLTWAAHEAAGRQTGLTIVRAYPRQPMWDPATMPRWAPEHVRFRHQALRLLSLAGEFVHSLAPALEVRRAAFGRPGAHHPFGGQAGRPDRPGPRPRAHPISHLARPRQVRLTGERCGVHRLQWSTPPANRVVAVLLPGQEHLHRAGRPRHGPHRGPKAPMACSPSRGTGPTLWQADLGGRGVLRVRARMSGHVDLDTRSLTGPDSALLPTDSLRSGAGRAGSPTAAARSSIGPPARRHDQLLRSRWLTHSRSSREVSAPGWAHDTPTNRTTVVHRREITMC